MSDLLDLSSRILDGETEASLPELRPNAVTNELHQLTDGVSMVESFSHVISFATDDGLVCFDASGPRSGAEVTDALRTWSTDRVNTLVYTHGHVDHVGGSGALVADGRERGHPDPRVVGHDNLPRRLDRYHRTNGWNNHINLRQFGGSARAQQLSIASERRFVPDDVARPTDTFTDASTVTVGGLRVELHHARGETDDHAWAWIPDHRAVCAGDLVLWVFPNAGNPQKVQRYAGDWAAALRRMAAREPELLLPAHGLPVVGRERIVPMLETIAGVLEDLETRVVEAMNAGAGLEEIVHTVTVDPDLLALPYLQPRYDEPEFVVRNIWRLYGGWWNGDPASLKPSAPGTLAAEVADLAGGAVALADRAAGRSADGDHRVACELIELAAGAAPDDPAIHRIRAQIYTARRNAESSLMARGIYADAARQSEAIIGAAGDGA